MHCYFLAIYKRAVQQYPHAFMLISPGLFGLIKLNAVPLQAAPGSQALAALILLSLSKFDNSGCLTQMDSPSICCLVSGLHCSS